MLEASDERRLKGQLCTGETSCPSFPIPFLPFGCESGGVLLHMPAALEGRLMRRTKYHDPDVELTCPVAVTLDLACIGDCDGAQIEIDQASAGKTDACDLACSPSTTYL